jgi:1,2-phenylacetyl-CoA epoxidase catalytic subunit
VIGDRKKFANCVVYTFLVGRFHVFLMSVLKYSSFGMLASLFE